MWYLSAPDQSVAITPEGGCITRWTSRGVEVLKPKPKSGGDFEGLPLWGSFPMAPFANRLSPTSLPATPAPVPIVENWPREGLALHGMAFSNPWRAVDVCEDQAQIETDLADASGHPLGLCAQTIALTPAGLSIDLSFRCDRSGSMPVGLGLHPWFPAPSTVTFSAAHRLDVDDRLSVVSVTSVGNLRLASARHNGHDHCYTGLTWPVSLEVENWPVPLLLRSDAPACHVFLNDDLDCVCIEPVTHAPNAAWNRIAAEHAPMAILSEGDTLRLSASFTWTDRDGRAQEGSTR